MVPLKKHLLFPKFYLFKLTVIHFFGESSTTRDMELALLYDNLQGNKGSVNHNQIIIIKTQIAVPS